MRHEEKRPMNIWLRQLPGFHGSTLCRDVRLNIAMAGGLWGCREELSQMGRTVEEW
jgi:hypothetical protein